MVLAADFSESRVLTPLGGSYKHTGLISSAAPFSFSTRPKTLTTPSETTHLPHGGENTLHLHHAERTSGRCFLFDSAFLWFPDLKNTALQEFANPGNRKNA
jgi:hypothetical protein